MIKISKFCPPFSMNYYYVIYYVKSFIRKDDDVCLSFHCCAPIFSPFSPTCRVFMYCAPYQVNKNNDYNDKVSSIYHDLQNSGLIHLPHLSGTCFNCLMY